MAFTRAKYAALALGALAAAGVVVQTGQLMAQDLMAQSDATQISEHVKVNQVGYLPEWRKLAMVTAPASGEAVVRRAEDGAEVLRVAVPAAQLDADSGDHVSVVEMAKLHKAGRYYLEVPGVGVSHPFEVGEDIYRRPLWLAMRSYYGQRCGTAVDMGREFPAFRYEACHTAPAQFHASSGKSGEVDVTGGWHDAGDYGRYVVNSGITTGTLLWAFEMNREKLEGMNLSIPESGGAVPDMLAEIRWNVDWMMKMQDADGGVWHKATSARFCGFVMPKDDPFEVLVIGNGVAPYKTTQSTADFAAVCAAAGRIYAPYDAAYAQKCLAAAEKAWAWLVATPDNMFERNPEGIRTGGYTDRKADDERLWAAAELFRTTGKAEYNQYFLANYRQWDPMIASGDPQGWPSVHHLAMYTYAMSGRDEADAEAVARITREAASAADRILARAEEKGYRIPLASTQYFWGSNSVLLNYAMMLIVADRLSPDVRYRQGALEALHYVLGRNTFNTSFVTHVGTKWAMNPHHRPSGADGVDEPWPGLIVGGPNSKNEIMRDMPADPNRPPAKAWVDHQASYSTNETAINWNAPLVFVLAEFAK